MAVGMPEDVARMVRSIPADQRLELDALFGSPRGQISILEPAAYLAGALLTGDYSQATLAIRDLTVDQALERLAGPAARQGLFPAEHLAPAEQLADLAGRRVLDTYRQVGLSSAETGPRIPPGVPAGSANLARRGPERPLLALARPVLL